MNGRRVVDVARETLDAAEALTRPWRKLAPIIEQLTERVQAQVTADEFEGYEAAKLLNLCASVVQKVGQASGGMLRASDGLHKLALLLSGGIERPSPKTLTEKQMAQLVIETVKRLAKEQGRCPVCEVKTVTTVTNGHADGG